MSNQSIDTFIANLPSQVKKDVQHLREIIKSVDDNLTEQIKWNAPSFGQEGDDRITFNLMPKGGYRIIFHLGAKLKIEKPKTNIINDTSGLLKWPSTDRAILTLKNREEISAHENAIKQLSSDWLAASKKLHKSKV